MSTQRPSWRWSGRNSGSRYPRSSAALSWAALNDVEANPLERVWLTSWTATTGAGGPRLTLGSPPSDTWTALLAAPEPPLALSHAAVYGNCRWSMGGP